MAHVRDWKGAGGDAAVDHSHTHRGNTIELEVTNTCKDRVIFRPDPTETINCFKSVLLLVNYL